MTDRIEIDQVREKLAMLVCKAHNAVTEKSFENADMSYAEAIGIETEVLIAHGVTVQEWIPFTEPPKKMKPVICLYENEDGTQVGGGYVNDHGIWTLIAPAKGTITHWMPLPQPPKGE